MKLGYLRLLLISLTTQMVLAAPVVIFDSGETRALSKYFKGLKGVIDSPLVQSPASQLGIMPEVLTRDKQQVLTQTFPVQTPELTAGRFLPLSVNFPYLTQPIFIVGNDETSKHWLQHHRQHLLQMQAVGLVVNVANAAELALLQKIGAPLSMYAFSGTTLARQWGLAHYPALITTTRIEQ